jgi:hypothetical protein
LPKIQVPYLNRWQKHRPHRSKTRLLPLSCHH